MKTEKLLIGLRTRIRELHEVYFSDNETIDDGGAFVEEYTFVEEYILKDGKKVKLTESGDREQIRLIDGERRLNTEKVMGGFKLEASLDHVFATDRSLIDGATHKPITSKERIVLEWALEEIKWLTANASGIIGADEDDE